MITLSAIVIAKNAEKLLTECLNSLSFCEEIIVVDAGSTDKTVHLARNLGAEVILCKSDSFAKLRNAGLNQAKGTWVLYIDTDERVSEELQKNIIKITQRETKFSVFKLKRKNFYLGKHAWPYIENLERFFKKAELKGWVGQLHESPEYTGEIGEIEGFIIHYSHRNLSEMVEKTNEWSYVEAQLRFDSHHPKMTWWRFLRVMATSFYESYFRQQGWKIGTPGLIESIYQSFSIFITYSKLWEMQEKTKN